MLLPLCQASTKSGLPVVWLQSVASSDDSVCVLRRDAWSRDHRSDDNTISSKVTKRLKPTRMIGLECVPFEGHIESICITYKFLKIFQGNLGRDEVRRRFSRRR